jgi:hypothetical protein
MAISSSYDRERLKTLLRHQFDVVSRSQLLECGMTRSAVQHLTSPSGRWLKLLPGIYVADSRITTERREMAAQLHAGPDGIITGPYAVRHYRLEASGPTTVEVLVPPDVRRMSSGFVRLIRTTRKPELTYRMDTIRFAGPTRAIADAIRGYTRISDARDLVCTAIRRDLCTFEDLAAELDDGPSRGSLLLRRSIRDAADGIWSAAEGDLMDLIRASDLEQPDFNVALYDADGTPLGVVDAWWQRAGVAAEVDSREFHFEDDDWAQTMARHNHITARLVRLFHLPPSRIKSDGAGILHELRTAIENGNRNPPLPIRGIPQRANGANGKP